MLTTGFLFGMNSRYDKGYLQFLDTIKKRIREVKDGKEPAKILNERIPLRLTREWGGIVPLIDLAASKYKADLEIMEELLNAGADPNIIQRCYSGNSRDSLANFSPLNRAVLGGGYDQVRLLLKHGASAKKDSLVLWYAVDKMWHPDCPQDVVKKVELLLQHGANPNYHADYPLHRLIYWTNAVKNNKSVPFNLSPGYRLLSLLIEHGANPYFKDCYEKTAIIQKMMKYEVN